MRLLKHSKNFLPTFLLLWGGWEAIYGCLQLYGFSASNHNLYKLTGSFQNPGPYAGFLAALLPVALWQALDCKVNNRYVQRIVKYTGWAYICLSLPLLPASQSRASWLAAGTGCLIVWATYYHFLSRFRQFFRKHRKRTIAALITVCLFIGCISYGIYCLKKDSADGRLLMWKVTACIIAEHPLTGVGRDKFAGAYGEAQASYFASGKATQQEEYVAGSPEYAFNEFLQITAETGITGLLLFLAILAFACTCACKTGQMGIMGSLTAWLTFACFSYPFSVRQLSLLFFILLAMAIVPWFLEKQNGKYNRWKIGLLCLSSTAVLFIFAYRWEKRHKRQALEERWHEEQTYYNMCIYEQTADNYRDLYVGLRDNPRFLFEYGQCLSKTGQYEESNRILCEGAKLSSDPMFWNIMGKNHQAMKQYEQAEACLRHAYRMVPNRLYPLYLLARLYFDSGNIEEALATARLVIDKEPKVMSDAIREMKTEMREKITEYSRR